MCAGVYQNDFNRARGRHTPAPVNVFRLERHEDFPDVPIFRGYAFFKPQRRSWSGDPFAIQSRRRESMNTVSRSKSASCVAPNMLTHKGKSFAWNSMFAPAVH